MGKDCINSVKWMNCIMKDFRSLVNDMMDDGYDYEDALNQAWPWVKPAKKRVYVGVRQHILAKTTRMSNE